MQDYEFEEFKRASYLLGVRLGMPKGKIKIEKTEDGETSYKKYGSSAKSDEYNFDFYMNNEGELFLDIEYSDSAREFHLNTNMWPQTRGIVSFVRRALYNFNLEYNPIKLDKLFTDPILVGGYPAQSSMNDFLIRFVLNGSLQNEKIKVKVYRFTHLHSDDYTFFSYAIWLGGSSAMPYGSDVWFFFPEAGGPSSGGASISYEIIEETIAKIKKVKKSTEIVDFDIEYYDLESFILRKQFGLNDARNTTIDQFELPSIYEEYFGSEIANAYEEFRRKYYDRKYPSALGDLRAIVQDALELFCDKSNMPISKQEPDINDISNHLISRKAIDPKLYTMIHAFTSYANKQGAHTRKDILGPNSYTNSRKRRDFYEWDNRRRTTILAFLLGVQILLEIQELLCSAEEEI